jgi:hypothetical protein
VSLARHSKIAECVRWLLLDFFFRSNQCAEAAEMVDMKQGVTLQTVYVAPLKNHAK